MDFTTQDAQNVIIMTHETPDNSYSLLSQVDAYWHALRGTQLLPKRSDIDPRGIEAALEYTFVLERIAPGVARLRIAGSHLSDLMGMEVRGMPITSFLTPDARRRFSDMMEELFETPATARIMLKGETGQIAGQMILLPLKSDMGDASRMLGCLVTKGPLPSGPCRFDIQNIQITPVGDQSGRYPLVPLRSAPAQGFSEPAADTGLSDRKKRPPYLRLVKSDD